MKSHRVKENKSSLMEFHDHSKSTSRKTSAARKYSQHSRKYSSNSQGYAYSEVNIETDHPTFDPKMPNMSDQMFVRRTKWYKFEDWFWLKSHEIFREHAIVGLRPSLVRNTKCAFCLRILLILF